MLPPSPSVELEGLDEKAATDLLDRIVGHRRTASEPVAFHDLVHLCGGLPLALRIAGARLAAKPHWRISDFVRRLEDRPRLDELSHGRLSVRSTLDVSYKGLAPAARRLYRLLGLVEADEFAGWLAGSLLAIDEAAGGELLEQLVDAQLLEAGVFSGKTSLRYRFHDLVREHARERCLAEDGPDLREEALERVLGSWLAVTSAIVRTLNGGGDMTSVVVPDGSSVPGSRVVEAAGWLEQERLNLVAAVRQAAELEQGELCWQLALMASLLFQPAHYVDEWEQVLDHALSSARTIADPRGEAVLAQCSAELNCARRDYEAAMEQARLALDRFVVIGDVHGRALAFRQLAIILRKTGRLADALSYASVARSILGGLGDVPGEAHALLVAGCVHFDRGAVREAFHTLSRARALAQSSDYTSVELQAFHWIGHTQLALAMPYEAERAFEYFRAAAGSAGSRLSEMYAVHGLGRTYAMLKRLDDAEASLRTALRWAEELGDRLMRARTLHALAAVLLDRGLLEDAHGLVLAGIGLAEEMNIPLAKAQCLELLADVLDDMGRRPDAASARAAAQSIFADLSAGRKSRRSVGRLPSAKL